MSRRERGEPPRRDARRDPRRLRAARRAARGAGAPARSPRRLSRAAGRASRSDDRRARSAAGGPGSRASSRPDPPPTAVITGMERAEREAIMRQGVVLPETPRERSERAALEEDLRDDLAHRKAASRSARGTSGPRRRVPLATRGPLAYMLRLREIEQRTEQHETSSGRPGTSSPRSARRRRSASAASGSRRRGGTPSTRSTTSSTGTTAGTRSNRGCRWIRGRATTRSSTAATTASRRSTRAWVLERFPAELRARRSPRPDERVDGVALLAVDVAQDGRGLLDLDARELGTRSARPCTGCPGRSAHRRRPSGS